MRLDKVTKKGTKCKIKAIKAKDALRYKLLDMGFVEGADCEVIRSAPLLDPIELKIHKYLLALRKSEASLIEVEVL
ncbi:MAG: FeoA domain-containing protein [Sulfurospirillaceae bacterium]|jgi:ferrous iron transport protein A|nr:FeoA domain-containing protein [Sulfurospirillaceae bacterium]MCK9545849.1 FeoA domain-containing protein [Sulfurospirillaceae bacterium]MDY0237916.1 FeoA domain-containing protein [Campylobacterales bacterium]NLM99006.1 ferrous iron transport protein A [Campylobacteraceae bacterium]